MAKNKSIDAGLKYLQEISFSRIRGKYGLADRLNTVFGKTKGAQIWKEWERLPTGSNEFYEFKNSDPEISRAFSEAYDDDIIRKACNYIDAHKEYFGSTILEVGCESGYMTGFLAKTFPEARIVSIDRSNAAIKMASHKLESMGVHNVELRIASLEDLSEQFDTVFCMRTILENIDIKDAPFEGEPLRYQFYQYDRLTEQFTSQLLSCLKAGGTLCIFERVGHDPLMCGWMMGLCLAEFAPDLSTYEEIICEEAGNQNTFQAFICHEKSKTDPQDIINLWHKAIQIDVSGHTTLTGWNALAYLDANAGSFVQGIRILDKDNKQVGRFALFCDKDDDSLMYFLSAKGGFDILLSGVNVKDKDNVLRTLQEITIQNVNAGFHEEVINSNEIYLEGRKPE